MEKPSKKLFLETIKQAAKQTNNPIINDIYNLVNEDDEFYKYMAEKLCNKSDQPKRRVTKAIKLCEKIVRDDLKKKL